MLRNSRSHVIKFGVSRDAGFFPLFQLEFTSMLSRTPPPLPPPSLSLPSRSAHAYSPRGPGLEPKRSAFLQARASIITSGSATPLLPPDVGRGAPRRSALVEVKELLERERRDQRRERHVLKRPTRPSWLDGELPTRARPYALARHEFGPVRVQSFHALEEATEAWRAYGDSPLAGARRLRRVLTGYRHGDVAGDRA